MPVVDPAGAARPGFDLKSVQLPLVSLVLRDADMRRVLPALALALSFSPIIARVLRSSLLEAASEAYVAVARLRGTSERRILWRHMLKNAALPTLTLLGVQFGFLFGGTLLIEVIFSFPGLGNLMVQAIKNFDFSKVVDNRIVRRLAAQGWFEQLYGPQIVDEQTRRLQEAV